MPSPALVSFLGVPGWGTLHLQLAASADPPALARRLRRAQASAGQAEAAAAVLSAFLRQERDAEPLARPWGVLPAGGRRLSHRYRICWAGTPPSLRVTAWCWQGVGKGWWPCASPLPLARFVDAFDPPHTGSAPPILPPGNTGGGEPGARLAHASFAAQEGSQGCLRVQADPP